jgi:pyridoxine 5-phosphate synthase
MIELHTGKYANLFLAANTNINKTKHKLFEDLDRKTIFDLLKAELKIIEDSAIFGYDLGLKVAAGHGLNYQNVQEIAKIKSIQELNIGHSIIANSIFVGLENAIKKMKNLINNV